MAYSTVAPGVGYKDPNDLNDKAFTPADSEFVAKTVAARLMELGASLGAMRRLVEFLAARDGLAPDAPVDGQTAALISQADSLTHQAILTVLGEHSLTLAVQAEAEGVVGDGVTDDTDAFHAAAAKAVSLGVPLVLRPGMSVGISYYKRLPEGLTLYTGGAAFQQITAMGRAPVIGLGPRSRVVGGLNVRTLGGDACQGVTIADAPDVVIDSVDVRAYTPGAGKGNIRDNGLRALNSDRLTIGRVFVENYSWPVWAELCNGLRFGWVEASGYAKAIHLDGCSHVQIRGGHVYGTAPNSQYAPGYNGLLIEADVPTSDIHVQNLTIEDAGEHGVRLSGPEVQREVYFQNCVTRNSGGTGFKVLGSLVENRKYNTGITFDNCTAIDSGSINQNCCGFLIQMAQHVTIVNPTVRRMDKDYSAVEGIRMSGVMHVTVVSPKIMDTQKYAVHIDEACGNVQDVTFTNLHISSETGQGIYLQNPGVEFRDVRFKGGLVEMWGTDAGAGFYAGRYLSEDTGTWRGMCELEMTFSDSTGATRQISEWCSPNALAAFIANVTMWRKADAAASWPEFAPGSMLLDRRIGARLVRSSSGVWNAA